MHEKFLYYVKLGFKPKVHSALEAAVTEATPTSDGSVDVCVKTANLNI